MFMVRSRPIQVWVTQKQYERLKEKAERLGFSSMSSYVRFRAIYEDFWLSQKVAKLEEKVFGVKNNGKFKENPNNVPPI